MNNNWMSKPRSRREALQSALGMGGLAMGAGMMSGLRDSRFGRARGQPQAG